MHWSGRSIKQPDEIIYYPQIEDFYPFQALYAGDGNEDHGAVYDLRDKNHFGILYYKYLENTYSSTHKELLVLKALILSGMAPPNSRILYVTDSMNLCNWINYGTCKPLYSSDLKRLHLACIDRDIELCMAWSAREVDVIKLADASCRGSTDEYGCRQEDNQFIREHFASNFDVDCFASPLMYAVDKFYTAYPMVGTAGCPGQNCQWDGLQLYIFPPRDLYYQCVERLNKAKHCSGVFLVLLNRENILQRTWLYNSNHFPDFVVKVARRSILLEAPDLDIKFTRSRHLCYFIFFDKDQKNEDLPSRCSQPPGHCPCGGNQHINDVVVKYSIPIRKNADCYFKMHS